MAKKQTPPEDGDSILTALQQIADGQPYRQLSGKGGAVGIFPGTPAKQKSLLQKALEEGWIEERPGPPEPPPPRQPPSPSGSKKPPKPKVVPPVPHARITAKGLEWVFQQLSPKPALEALKGPIARLAERLTPAPAPANELAAHFDRLQQGLAEIRHAFQEAEERRLAELRSLGQTVAAFAAVVERSVQTLPAAAAPVNPRAALEGQAVVFVQRWQAERRADCPFHELYQHLQRAAPTLSMGEFHDLLRTLKTQDRLRLTGWSGSLDTMPHPESALFVSSKVVYYAHVPAH